MNQNMCYQCGGTYEFRNGRLVCRNCGSYGLENIPGEELTLLWGAYQNLRLSEFDMAKKQFNDIIERYPQNPNGYWGRLMARYKVEYKRNNDKVVLTCGSTLQHSVFSDPDYKNTICYADKDTRTYYRQRAEDIERARKQVVSKLIVGKKENFIGVIIKPKKKSKAPFFIIISLLLGLLIWVIFGNSSECDHVIVTDPAVPATCTQTGLTEGKHCSVCQEVFLTQKVVPASHKPGEAPDCEVAQYCTVCHKELTPALGHVLGKDATCTTAQKCLICNEELTPALGHRPGEGATCTTAQTCIGCNLILTPAKGHAIEVLEAVAPTNEKNGLTAGEWCAVCKAIFVEQKMTILVILGSVEDGAVPPTKTVTLGAEYGDLPVPEKEGHAFDGWYLNDLKIDSSTKLTVSHAHILEPHWKINQYFIRYDTADGEHFEDSVYEYGSLTDFCLNPLRSGYDFIGWKFYNADTSEEINFSYGNAMPAHNVIAVAQWTYKSIGNLLIDNDDKVIDDVTSYHEDYFDISEFSVFMDSSYTFHFVFRVYMREINEGYQKIELANSDNEILGGYGADDNYCYGGSGKDANLGWSDYIFVDVSGELCSNEMHMIYSAFGAFADDWERQGLEISLTITKNEQ